MVNSIIVTVRGDKSLDGLDLELPCNVLISDLKRQLTGIETISSRNIRKVHLYYKGQELRDNTSLGENGIWDGCVLAIAFE